MVYAGSTNRKRDGRRDIKCDKNPIVSATERVIEGNDRKRDEYLPENIFEIKSPCVKYIVHTLTQGIFLLTAIAAEYYAVV